VNFHTQIFLKIITSLPTHIVYGYGAELTVVGVCLSSSVVRNAAGGRAGRPPGAWVVGRPALHGGPHRDAR